MLDQIRKTLKRNIVLTVFLSLFAIIAWNMLPDVGHISFLNHIILSLVNWGILVLDIFRNRIFDLKAWRQTINYLYYPLYNYLPHYSKCISNYRLYYNVQLSCSNACHISFWHYLHITKNKFKVYRKCQNESQSTQQRKKNLQCIIVSL